MENDGAHSLAADWALMFESPRSGAQDAAELRRFKRSPLLTGRLGGRHLGSRGADELKGAGFYYPSPAGHFWPSDLRIPASSAVLTRAKPTTQTAPAEVSDGGRLLFFVEPAFEKMDAVPRRWDGTAQDPASSDIRLY